MSEWISTEAQLPTGEALIWSSGRFAIASLVVRPDGSRIFMESYNDSVLDWPSHWMALPDTPNPKDALVD